MEAKKTMKPLKIAIWNKIKDRTPNYTLVANVDLVAVRYDNNVSVLYHRGESTPLF